MVVGALLGLSRGPFAAPWALPGAPWGPLRAVLGPSWAISGRLGLGKAFRSHLGTLLGPSWAPLGLLLGALLGPSWAPWWPS